MNRGQLAGLGPSALAQIEKALAEEPLPPRRRSQRTAPQGRSLVTCCTEGCEFPPTASVAAMERHCDKSGHHRYAMVLS